jgi:hypothetical protein
MYLSRLLGILVVAGCGASADGPVLGPELGDDGAAAARRGGKSMVTVPIRGTWDNEELGLSATPPAGCMVFLETAQTGNASHLGRFSGRGGTCVTTQQQTDSPPFWDHEPAPPYALMDFTNEMAWTAANGDELWLRPNGGVFVMSLANGAASVRGQLTIAGGTGRFEGATGTLAVSGGRQAGEPGDHLSYEGEISLRPGAAASR